MKRILAVVGCVLVLAGCSAPTWEKYGASEADYAAAHDACVKDAAQNGYIGESLLGNGLLSEINWPSQYRACMDTKGWYQNIGPKTES